MRRAGRAVGDGACWLLGQALGLAALGLLLWMLLWAWVSWEAGDRVGAAETVAIGLAWLSVPLAYWFLDGLRRDRRDMQGRERPAGDRPRQPAGPLRSRRLRR